MTKNSANVFFIAKGDLLISGFLGSPISLPVGSDGLALTSNSSLPSKLGYATLNSPATSWVPVVTGSSGTGTATYSVQNGIYVTLGNLIFVWGTLSFSSFTGTGNLRVSLPIVLGPSNNAPQQGNVVFDGAYSAGDNVNLEAVASTSFAYINCSASGISPAIQQCVASATLNFFINYALD